MPLRLQRQQTRSLGQPFCSVRWRRLCFLLLAVSSRITTNAQGVFLHIYLGVSRTSGIRYSVDGGCVSGLSLVRSKLQQRLFFCGSTQQPRRPALRHRANLLPSGMSSTLVCISVHLTGVRRNEQRTKAKHGFATAPHNFLPTLYLSTHQRKDLNPSQTHLTESIAIATNIHHGNALPEQKRHYFLWISPTPTSSGSSRMGKGAFARAGRFLLEASWRPTDDVGVGRARAGLVRRGGVACILPPSKRVDAH